MLSLAPLSLFYLGEVLYMFSLFGVELIDFLSVKSASLVLFFLKGESCELFPPGLNFGLRKEPWGVILSSVCALVWTDGYANFKDDMCLIFPSESSISMGLTNSKVLFIARPAF